MEPIDRNNDEIEIDLREVYYLLKSRIVAILVSVVLFAVLGGLYFEFRVTPMYSSTIKLYIMSMADTSLASLSLSDLQIGASLTSDYEELIQSRPAVEEVIEDLDLDMTYEQMLGKMTIYNKENTRILAVTIEDPDPVMAKKMADKFAEVAIKRLSQIMSIEEPHLVEEGHVMESPINQNLKKYAAVGGALGAMAAVGFIMLRYLMDDSIHSAEDIEKHLDLNILAMIPMGEEEYDRPEHRRGRLGKHRQHNKDTASAKAG